MCHSDLHKRLEVPKPCSWTHAHPRVSFWASISWANHLFCCIMHANLLADGLMGWQGSIYWSLHITFIIMCMYYCKNRHMCVQFTCLPCIMLQSTSPLCLSWLFSHFLQCSPLVFNPRASSVGFSLHLCQCASICARRLSSAPDLFPGKTNDNVQYIQLLSYDKVSGWLPLISAKKGWKVWL